MKRIKLSQIACPGGIVYTIRAGDTLNALASRFGTTVPAILGANPGLNPYNLQIGQAICIPNTPASCPGGTFYTIQAGDTLYLIAQRFGITLAALLAANPGVDPVRLSIGQRICVPAVLPRPVICMMALHAQNTPPGQRLPGGVLFDKPGAGGNSTVTFTAVDLPEPSTLGNYDTYIGRVDILTGTPFTYTIPLNRAIMRLSGYLGGQPGCYAGSDRPGCRDGQAVLHCRRRCRRSRAHGRHGVLRLKPWSRVASFEPRVKTSSEGSLGRLARGGHQPPRHGLEPGLCRKMVSYGYAVNSA